MSNLKKTDSHLKNLCTDEKNIISSYINDKRISELDKESKRNNLIDVIAIIIWESGYNIPKKEQELLINYMIDEIDKYFHYLTIQEIKLALQKGVRGMYGDVIGMNVRMMYKWLYVYVKETRVEILKKLPRTEDNKIITEEEKRVIRTNWINTCISFYERWRDIGYDGFIDFNNSFYNYINSELKVVELTKKERTDIWKSAINEYKSFGIKDKISNKSIRFKDALNKFNAGDDGEVNKVRVIARNLALRKIFEKIKASDINLREIVYQNEKKRGRI